MADGRREYKRPTPERLANYIPRVIVKLRENDNSAMPPDERERNQNDEIKRYDDIGQNPKGYLGASWDTLVKQHPGLTIQKLITSVSPQQIIEIRKKARRPDQAYRPANFMTYFAVRCPSVEVAQKVAEMFRNHDLWPTVESAYVEGGPDLPPGVILGPNESKDQKHLDPSIANGGDPGGIDARYAWPISGGDGDVGSAQIGLQFVDLEYGWVLNHEDLPTTIPVPISIDPVMVPGDNDSVYQGHGTGVLGIVVAVPNNVEVAANRRMCVGITPHVKTTKVVSPWVFDDKTWTYSVANAILAALSLPLNPGDVLLLEVQTRKSSTIGFGYPVEIYQAEFDAIKTATDADIIVIEAAGNAGDNLDNVVANNWTTESGGVVSNIQFSLNLLNANFQDSGAIMVGAALMASAAEVASAASASIPVIIIPRSRRENYGTRIDCYAWDNSIWTTGYDDDTGPSPGQTPKTSYFGFSGTSGASAIIAGAVLAIQGIAQVHGKGDLANHRFSPTRLRRILRDPRTGTLSANSTWNTGFNPAWDPDPMNNPDFSKWNADSIGAMPDLRKIIDNTLNVVPPAAPTGLGVR